ncbi:MAG TPA: cell division protein SepF, partial [Actinopolymorphaceae bacterium]|nr:cell division protein SepF [Actinopolymorphaceae bacterium]
MASAMRKMAVYLGLVEDGSPFPDKYDAYDEYEEYDEQEDLVESAPVRTDYGYPGGDHRVAEEAPHQVELARITTLHPRTYNEARTIGEHFREGTPVIMNLTEMVDSDARRLVDFAAGLIFGLRG